MILPVRTRYMFELIEADFTEGCRESYDDNPVCRCMKRMGMVAPYADKFTGGMSWTRLGERYNATIPREICWMLKEYDVDGRIAPQSFTADAFVELRINEPEEQ